MGRRAQVSKMDLTFLSVGIGLLAGAWPGSVCHSEGVRLGQVVEVITLPQ